MEDEIEAIRERHEAEIREPNKWTFNRAETAHADRATLLRLLDAERARRVEWQPIETAPKDRLIDIWIKNSDTQGVRWAGCYYDQITDQWRTAPGGHLMWVPAKAVTHWQPLPTPPATQHEDTP